jgi:biotin carboxyl carrier protein
MEDKIRHLLIDDTKYETEVPERFTGKEEKEAAGSEEIRAVIPGVIVAVKVRKGQKVTAGDVVIVLEAMKMYNDIEAEADGKIAEIFVSEGDKVAKNQLMIRLD